MMACLALCGCYQSHAMQGGDAGTDVVADPMVDTAMDTIVDTPTDDGMVSPEWVDRNVPDRVIEPELLFAGLPDLAWNGRIVALVYNGQPVGSGREQLGFIPLDGRGNVVGDEKVVVEGGGLTSAFPRISAAEDGNFLFCTVSESGRDHVYMAVLDEEGNTLVSANAPPGDSLSDVMGAPVQVGESVYVAVTSFVDDEEPVILYRFSYPDLVFEGSAQLGMEDSVGEDPVLVPSTEEYDTAMLLFSRNLEREVVGYNLVNEAMETWGGYRSLDEFSPVDAFAVATTPSQYCVFSTRFLGMGAGISLSVLLGGEAMVTSTIAGKFYGHTVDADASETGRWGGTFVMIEEDDTASVYARVGGRVGDDMVSALVDVSDEGEGRLTDIPFPAIAWTGDGFLVVWDDWREGATYALFGSYVELVGD